MTTKTPDSLQRLRVANPAPIDPERGASVIARSALHTILADSRPVVTSRPRSPRRSRLVVIALAASVASGAAVAATDPFGWWSPNPNTAMYAIDPAVRVPTPSQAQIVCPGHPSPVVLCTAHGNGQRYLKLDTVRRPAPSSAFSREHLLAAIARRLAAGKMSAATAARYRADLARVPDGFFSKLELAARFATYRAGNRSQGQKVPPAGIPEFLVCTTSGSALSCRNLNGDAHAPIGAGIYLAQQAPDWRLAPLRQHSTQLPPGIAFTPAEDRVLTALLSTATVTHSHSHASGARAQTSSTLAQSQPR